MQAAPGRSVIVDKAAPFSHGPIPPGDTQLQAVSRQPSQQPREWKVLAAHRSICSRALGNEGVSTSRPVKRDS